MRLVLIGYRGTGKTTIGRIVAQDLNWPFVDTDPLIEQRAGLDITEIFARFGETHFRDLETAVIADLELMNPVVISAGGGAVLRPENVQRLRNDSLVVWLTATAETLHQRIAADATTSRRRPSLTALTNLQEIRHLLEVREPFYRPAAHVTLDTEMTSPQKLAEQILQHVRRWKETDHT